MPTETPFFNVIDEPWILAMNAEGKVEEISLKKLLLQANEYIMLSGETKAQDVAVLRCLCAVILSIFTRVDENNAVSSIDSPKEALRRFKAIWDEGSFPEAAIIDYLEKHRDRFFLFHPTHPFFQNPNAINGTKFFTPKLYSDLLQSANKERLFASKGSELTKKMAYGQAVRSLIYLNSFDDTASKPLGFAKNKSKKNEKEGPKKEKKKNTSSTGEPLGGISWLGRLGLVYANGKNLFETLLLNSPFYDIENNCAWGESKPQWELEEQYTECKREIPHPNNLPELYTIQNRRIILCHEDGWVTGFYSYYGDSISMLNAKVEPMTIWRSASNKKQPIDTDGIVPKIHDPSTYAWQEFSTMIQSKDGITQPGIVRWTKILKKNNCCEGYDMARFSTLSAMYGNQNARISDFYGDSLSFNADILLDAGEAWQEHIADCISITDSIAYAVGELAGSVQVAKGKAEYDKKGNFISSPNNKSGRQAKEKYYFKIDVPFRRWLQGINPEQDAFEQEDIVDNWIKQAKSHAYAIVGEIIDQNCDSAALVGRTVKIGENKTKHYSMPEAKNLFNYRIWKISQKAE